MKKIPTLFRRDPDDLSRVLDEVHPDCRWVLDGGGVATRKYDGTCVMFDGSAWWARREVKAGKAEPDGFRAEQHDEETGKTVGWEPVEQSSFVKAFNEATANTDDGDWRPGTYELCGPKVQSNPEGYDHHELVRHDTAEVIDPPRDHDGLAGWLVNRNIEGVVWHHPDGRMAKIKGRDFGFRRAGIKP